MNRYFVPFLNESARMAEEGVASLATIEEVGRECFGAGLGPFELMNVTGIPIAYHSESSLAEAFGRRTSRRGGSKRSSGRAFPGRGRKARSSRRRRRRSELASSA